MIVNDNPKRQHFFNKTRRHSKLRLEKMEFYNFGLDLQYSNHPNEGALWNKND